MEIIYTEYAGETLLDREISKEYVEDALLNPEEIVDGKKGRKIAHKLFEGRLLRVIFEMDTKTYKVVTAYFTNPQRYIRK